MGKETQTKEKELRQEWRQEFNLFKTDLLNTVKQEIDLKVRKEIGQIFLKKLDQTRIEIVEAVNNSGDKVIEAIDKSTERILCEMGTGDQQTHELLSNIAGIMTNMDKTVANMDKTLASMDKTLASMDKTLANMDKTMAKFVEKPNLSNSRKLKK